jgi:hypothetical protein
MTLSQTSLVGYSYILFALASLYSSAMEGAINWLFDQGLKGLRREAAGVVLRGRGG